MYEPIMSVPMARKFLGDIGKTRLYELIAQGRLTAVKIGRRTFVTKASATKLIFDCTVDGSQPGPAS